MPTIRNTVKISKEDSAKEKEKNKRVFVDRDDQINTFREMVEGLKDTTANACIYFWGVGGVGKSHLIRHLLKEKNETTFDDERDGRNTSFNLIDRKPAPLENQIRAYHNLYNTTNEIEVLWSLKKQIIADVKKRTDRDVNFLLFDTAVGFYEKKTQGKLNLDDTKRKEASSSVFNELINAKIPGLNIPFKKWFDAAEDGLDSLNRIINAHQNKLRKSEYEDYIKTVITGSEETILKKIHKGFALDYNRMIRELREDYPECLPVVLCIDTYELMEFNLNKEEYINRKEYDDAWLFRTPVENEDGEADDAGLTWLCESTLWVFSGRDELPETKIPKDNQIEVKMLEGKYVYEILEERGIHDERIAEAIYKVTEGLPVFIDVCVETCIIKGSTVKPEDFEGNITEIVDRYLQLMDDDDKAHLYVMSMLGQWNDEDYKDLANMMGSYYGLTDISYNRMIEKSFISKEKEERYIFHDKIREIIFSNKKFNQNMKDERLEKIVEFYKSRINSPDISKEEASYYSDRTKFLMEKIVSNEKQYAMVSDLTESFINSDSLASVPKRIDLLEAQYAKSKEFAEIDERLKLYNRILSSYITISNYPMARKFVKEIDGLYKKVSSKDLAELIGLLKRLSSISFSHYEDIKNYQKIYEIQKEKFGEIHPETVETMKSLAAFYSLSKQHDKAIKFYQKIYDIQKEKLGENHPDTIKAADELAYAYGRAGQRDKSIEILQKNYYVQKEEFGEDHPDTIKALYNLALLYKANDLYDEAIEIFQKIHCIQKASLGEDHPDAIQTLKKLAWTYFDANRHDKAIEFYQKIYDIKKTKLGEDHPDTIKAADDLVSILREAKQDDKVFEIYKKRYVNKKERFGDDDPKTIEALRNLAKAYSIAKKPDKAIEIYQQIYDIQKEKLGEDHPDTFKAAKDLAWAFRNDQIDKTLEIYQKIYGIQKEKLGETDSDTIETMKDLAWFFRSNDQNDKAIEIYQKIYDIQKEKLGETDSDTIETMKDLARYYSLAKQHDKAIEIYQKIYEIQKEKLGEDHVETSRAFKVLVEECEDNKRYDKVLEIYQEIYDTGRENLGDDHPYTLASLSDIAWAYYDNDQKEKALETIEHAATLAKNVYKENDEKYLRILYSLAYIQGENGKWEEAEKNDRFVYEHRKEILGEDHRDTITSLNNLAYDLNELGDYKQSLEYYRIVYEWRLKNLGENDKKTQKTKERINELEEKLHCQDE